MKLIYVASPYRGAIKKNLKYAKKCCSFVVNQNCNFYCPHLLVTQVLDDTNDIEREYGMFLAKDMLLKCDEVWVFGNVITEGMFMETKLAEEHNIPVKRVNLC